ncbi:MAG: metallophosphoesterase, partial [Oscillatoriales cyanobacterium SM2_2_1]|nr:metallophosphoesterase [Oscillatoriales cyanobacterium SM2_2_1]
MELITDPPIPVKIRKMKERVRWQHPLIAQRGIDQTRFVLDDGGQERPDFSFLAIGDSGWSTAHKPFPQRKIAELMVQQREGCRFVLHTGDVIYQVGSKEYYPANFIEPYREFLLGGERPQSIPYDRMVFSLPVFPAPGNHDYYDLSGFLGALVQATRPLRTLLGLPAELNLGWHGSHCG